MTKVSFYRLGEETAALLWLVDSLLKLSRQRRLDMLLYLDSEPEARRLQRALSSHINGGMALDIGPIPGARQCISWCDDPGEHHGLLVNLSSRLPTWFSRFDQMVEVVGGNATYVEKKRENYRFYRQRGYPLRYLDVTGDPSRQPIQLFPAI